MALDDHRLGLKPRSAKSQGPLTISAEPRNVTRRHLLRREGASHSSQDWCSSPPLAAEALPHHRRLPQHQVRQRLRRR